MLGEDAFITIVDEDFDLDRIGTFFPGGKSRGKINVFGDYPFGISLYSTVKNRHRVATILFRRKQQLNSFIKKINKVN